MLADLHEDYEIDNDELIELPQIKEMHYELINESIQEQVDDPFESKTNFIDTYFELIESQLESNGENPEVSESIKNDAIQFCLEIVKKIDGKYNIDVDMDTLEEKSLEDIKAFTYSLYDFFLIHYPKNLKKFFVKYIVSHMDDIANSLDHLKDRNDVVTNSLKNKLQDDRAVLILSNLKTVIEHIDTLDISGLDILGVYNPERYEIYVLSEAIQDCLISDSFAHSFFYPLVGDFEDDNYTNIYLAIESGLLKKFKKTVGVDND